MQTRLRYRTSIENQRIAERFILQLRMLIADFVIRFEREQNAYILTLEGNRDVSQLIPDALSRQGIAYRFIPEETTNFKPYM